MTTAHADALVSYAGKTDEQSAGRSVGRPSIGRGDGVRACGRTGVARGEDS